METKTENDLKEIREIEYLLDKLIFISEISYTNYEYEFRDWCQKTKKHWLIKNFKDFLKQKAQKIAEDNVFKGGCGRSLGNTGLKCSDGDLCKKCQAKKEIQEVWESIKNG
jgi:hypothetical protein